MLLENLMKFKDPLPEKFSETYKHKTAYTTSGDSQILKAHIQIPGGGMVLTLDVFELLTCAKHHGDPTPNSTHYHTECWTMPCLERLSSSFLPRKHLLSSTSPLK